MAKVFPNLTALKQLSFSYESPYENLQATPTALPTAEPATAQISYTVASADLPTINQNVESKVYIACMYAAGLNTDTVSRTVYWRMLKNGGSVATGNFQTLSANNFWTLNSFFYNVAVGDVLELRLWATSTLVNWDYEARQIHLTRVALYEKEVLWLYQLKTVSYQPTLTLGNPTLSSSATYFYHKSNAFSSTSSETDFSPWQPNPTYKLFRVYYGDISLYNTATILASATNRPRYYANRLPALLHIRALKTLS